MQSKLNNSDRNIHNKNIKNKYRITKSIVNSKEESNSDYNDGLIINELKWNECDKYKIDDIGDWLILNDFISMKDHYNTLLYDIHTLELKLN